METGCLYGARLFVKKVPGLCGPGSELGDVTFFDMVRTLSECSRVSERIVTNRRERLPSEQGSVTNKLHARRAVSPTRS
jgi:hypothetical protein